MTVRAPLRRTGVLAMASAALKRYNITAVTSLSMFMFMFYTIPATTLESSSASTPSHDSATGPCFSSSSGRGCRLEETPGTADASAGKERRVEECT
ncbi:Os02g0547900 [Oryza sativa Japonica Group]|uniref:Os02g0547900 protein n=1 Tax=Oryza sativa subsp. japonica TaxID=39947 RepID=A0A0P0VK61_ORYSJ|nr:Os02g0547900 [Oryza sativa Japonica Group]